MAGLDVLAGDLLNVMRFYTRLPLPVFRFEREAHALPDFRRAAWAIPVTGAVVGSCGALAGGLAYLAGLSPLIGAALAMAVQVAITGAFHEDGLADSCDGLFGGATPERRLEIMKDSRIGTFGGAGLVFALLLRVLALAELFRLMGPAALALLPGIAALSRGVALMPVLILSPAGSQGLSASVPLPDLPAWLVAVTLGGVVHAGACLWLDLPLGGLVAALGALLLMPALAALARSKIGGHNGDILGACQQVAEIALLLALSSAANWRGPL
ncbi:MAG: adenosylcobinamide-GDP ribazoletransferase [Beijerinckiaceae bacterium]|jgi:adenosylcobinamide-GDP ribazoletransferase|nr:adenosylcobinamide-GDP ribazoletransferase [Beijerinckiaceae bacterium]